MNSSASPVCASVVIPTFNRARLLGETLDRIAQLRPSLAAWDVIVVDNNSTDETRASVEQRQESFPVPLHYVFEPRQGRSWALNAGVEASAAPILVFTDDDVLVGDEWLDAAVAPLLGEEFDYTGGPVRPIWAARKPAWLDERGNLGGTIAVKHHGHVPFIFEERRKTPLGANMAVHRRLFDCAGLFNVTLGRTGSSKQLLGQEVPEFLARARAAGRRGLYVPSMTVDHHVPSERLTKRYFRRWWYGKGLSRAHLDRLQPITELGVDLSATRHLGGIPLFMFRTALMNAVGWLIAVAGRTPQERFEHAMMLCYFAGYVAGSRRAPHQLTVAQAN
jgi:glycosyltransferase involved in cell wall biosynthesis